MSESEINSQLAKLGVFIAHDDSFSNGFMKAACMCVWLVKTGKHFSKAIIRIVRVLIRIAGGGSCFSYDDSSTVKGSRCGGKQC